VKIEKATINDHEILTEITKKSKAFWGYSAAQMLLWSDDLTITKVYLELNEAFKLLNDGVAIGYYAYRMEENSRARLDNLFLLPEYIGKGFGKYLAGDFIARMRTQKIKKIILDADPNATEFYLKIGFEKIGEVETSIKNRLMPIMEMNL